MTLAELIPATKASALKAYYKCDEASGTTLADSSGNSKDLTLTGTPSTDYTLNQTGQEGGAIRFLGIAGYASRTDSVLGDSPTSSFTIHALIKGAAGQTSANITGVSSTTDNDPWIRLGTGVGGADSNIRGWTRNATSTTESQLLGGVALDNAWHSVVYRRNVNSFSVWVDGVLAASGSSAPGVTVQDRTSIGALVRASVGGYFNGYVQHVAYWDTALPKEYIEDLYRTGMGVAQPADTIYDLFSSWWVLPRAVTVGSEVWAGGVATDGRMAVAPLGGRKIVVREGISSDDHNTVGILAPADKPPVVFFFDHAGGVDDLQYKIGTVNQDFSTLGTTQTKTLSASGNVSYVQVFREPGTDNVTVFTRLSETRWHVLRSTDYCATFGASQSFVDFGTGNQGYMCATQLADGNLRVALYGHPTSSDVPDIFYCHINLATGAVSRVDGTVIGNIQSGTSMPFATSSLSLVYDVNDGVEGSRLFDVSDGPEIEVAFATWTSDTNTVYKRARWTGIEWEVTTICTAGVVFGNQPTVHYNGGMSFPKGSAGGRVFVSREDEGAWTIEQYDTEDDATWTAAVLATAPEGKKYIRPYGLEREDPFGVLFIDCSLYGGDDPASYQTYAGDMRGIALEPDEAPATTYTLHVRVAAPSTGATASAVIVAE